jgi:hypothetical protein
MNSLSIPHLVHVSKQKEMNEKVANINSIDKSRWEKGKK